jgi:IS30 family transposase
MRRNSIPVETWDSMTMQLELGLLHASDIAVALGVSPQTVGREMRKRGARKGSRAHESIRPLTEALDRNDAQQKLLEISQSRHVCRMAELNLEAVRDLMQAVFEAERMGNIQLAQPAIDGMERVFSHRDRQKRT